LQEETQEEFEPMSENITGTQKRNTIKTQKSHQRGREERVVEKYYVRGCQIKVRRFRGEREGGRRREILTRTKKE